MKGPDKQIQIFRPQKLSVNFSIAVYLSHFPIFFYKNLRRGRESFILLKYHKKCNFPAISRNLRDIKKFCTTSDLVWLSGYPLDGFVSPADLWGEYMHACITLIHASRSTDSVEKDTNSHRISDLEFRVYNRFCQIAWASRFQDVWLCTLVHQKHPHYTNMISFVLMHVDAT